MNTLKQDLELLKAHDDRLELFIVREAQNTSYGKAINTLVVKVLTKKHQGWPEYEDLVDAIDDIVVKHRLSAVYHRHAVEDNFDIGRDPYHLRMLKVVFKIRE